MVYFLPHFVFLNYYHYSLLFLLLLCLKVNSNELGSTLVKTSSTHNTISLSLDHILRAVAFKFILLILYKVLQQYTGYHHYFPNLLFLHWYVLIARIKSILRNSGQNTSINTNSLYALCHIRKPLSRFSPDVLNIRSGSACGK